MNNKGQVQLLGVMLFAIAFFAAIMMLKPMISVADDVRADIGCDEDGKSQGTYIACLGIDIFPALFFTTLILGGAGLMIAGGNKGAA